MNRRNRALDGLEVAVVNLARSANVPQILPAAMYAIAMKASEAIFTEGILLSDGSRALLDHRDQRTCLFARLRIGAFMDEKVIQKLVYDRKCCVRKICTNDLVEVVDCTRSIRNGTLGPLHGAFWQMHQQGKDCPCMWGLLRSAPWIHNEAWRLLPGWFGLGSWEAVLDE